MQSAWEHLPESKARVMRVTCGDALRPEWTSGWKALVAAGIGSGMGMALFQTTAGVFIKPMQDNLGWSVASLAIAPFVLMLSSLFLPLGGVIIDRFGARPTAILGLSLMALAYVLFAVTPANHLAYYLIAGIMAVISPFAYHGPFLKIVGGWFRRNTGLAMGITMTGVYASALMVLPVLGYVIDEWGWRAGYLLMAFLVAFVGLPIVVAFLKPAPCGEEADQDELAGAEAAERRSHTVRQAICDKRFWLLILSFSSATMAIGGFVAHLQPLLRHVEYSTQQAASVGVLFAACTGIGRLAGGLMLDRYPPFVVASISSLLPIAGAIYLGGIAQDSLAVITIVAVALIGISQGSEGDFLAFFTQKLFGQESFSAIWGILAMAATLGSAAGGIAFSFIFNATGSYSMGCYISGYLYFQSAILLAIAGFIHKKMNKL